MGAKMRNAARRRAGQLLTLFPVLFSLALIAAAVPHVWRMPHARTPTGGPFSLVASDGAQVTEHSWPGRFLLVYFGYTHCAAACPTALNNMQAAIDILGRQGEAVQPLFITLDPRRDTPAWLHRYTAMFGPRLVGLTGTENAIEEAARNYAIAYRAVPTGAGPDDYEMEHSSVITLMRPNGRFDASFPANEDPAKLAGDIAAHLGT